MEMENYFVNLFENKLASSFDSQKIKNESVDSVSINNPRDLCYHKTFFVLCYHNTYPWKTMIGIMLTYPNGGVYNFGNKRSIGVINIKLNFKRFVLLIWSFLISIFCNILLNQVLLLLLFFYIIVLLYFLLAIILVSIWRISKLM